MIIGVYSNTGPGSGKDEVAKMLRFFHSIEEKELNSSIDYLFDYYCRDVISDSYVYAIKKFATPLKQIVSILTGYTTDELENRKIKESILGKEWWSIKTHDQIFDYESFDSRIFDGNDSVQLRELKPSVRDLLRYIGTDLFRDQLQPNIWVNTLFKDYKPFSKGKPFDLFDQSSSAYHNFSCNHCKKPFLGYKRSRFCNDCIDNDSFQFYPTWFISDLRFLNEAHEIRNRNGITICIDRPTVNDDSLVTHSSESELKEWKEDYYLLNDNSLEYLFESVLEIYNKIKKGLV